jgi:hypothetical protein
MTRPVIFLDIDGVLNTHDGWEKGFHGHAGLDPDPVRRLNDLCEMTHAYIVVSSTWRGGPYRGPQGCRAVLRRFGVTGAFHPQWRTRRWRKPDEQTYEDRPRGKQIRDWLLAHPEVTSWVIIDDDSDMLPEQMPRYVQTRHKDGLQDAHVERIAALLEA